MEKEYIQILNRIYSLKSEIDTFRPIPPDVEGRIVQKLRLDWNYNSLAIEGNSLNYGETIAFIMHGVTAKGKPLKDHLDLKGHNKAIDFIMEIVKNFDRFTESDLRQLHELILVEPYEVDAVTPDGKPTKKMITIGSYKTSANHVQTKTGEIHYYASVEDTPAKMTDLMRWFNKMNHDSEVHPLIFATFFHHKFVAIHPFDDGNGRMARLLMNLILLKNHFPPIVVKLADRNEYYGALAQADAGDMSALISFLGENLIHSLEICLKGAKGESIDDADDLDKEIALFKKEAIGNKVRIKEVFTNEVGERIVSSVFKPFLFQLLEKSKSFSELFINIENKILKIDLVTNFGNSEKWCTYKDFKVENLNLSDFNVGKIFVFRFNDFIIKDNPFSVELLIFFKLQKLEYTVSYYFADKDEYQSESYEFEYFHGSITKMYHEDFDYRKFVSLIYSEFLKKVRNKKLNTDCCDLESLSKVYLSTLEKMH